MLLFPQVIFLPPELPTLKLPFQWVALTVIRRTARHIEPLLVVEAVLAISCNDTTSNTVFDRSGSTPLHERLAVTFTLMCIRGAKPGDVPALCSMTFAIGQLQVKRS